MLTTGVDGSSATAACAVDVRRGVPQHVFSVVGAEPRVFTERHVEALARAEVDGVAGEPSPCRWVGCRCVALVHRRCSHPDLRSGRSYRLKDDDAGELLATVLCQVSFDRLHLQYRATRPLGLVARNDDVDVVQTADARERREVALKTVNGRCDVRELDDFARSNSTSALVLTRQYGAQVPPKMPSYTSSSSSGLPVLRSLKMTSEGTSSAPSWLPARIQLSR